MRSFLAGILLAGALLPAAAVSQVQRGGTTTPPANANNRLNMEVYRRAVRYGDMGTAITALQYELAADPNNMALRDSLASVYFSGNMYPQSILVAKEVLDAQPQNQKMLELTAIAYQSMGSAKEALNAYEKLYPLSKQAYHLYQVAVLQFQLQRFGECQSTIAQLVSDPKSEQEKVTISISQNNRQEVNIKAAAYNVLGVMFQEQHNKENARKAFQQSLQAAPDFVLPKGNLEQLDHAEAPAQPAQNSTNGQASPTPANNGTSGNPAPETAPDNSGGRRRTRGGN